MTFQAYLDNIEKQTGVAPDEFIRLATDKGFTTPGHQGDGRSPTGSRPTTGSATATPWPSSSC